MAMDCLGLSKVIEECGELIQICAKKQAYLTTDEHPDGKGSMKQRLAEEIADVLAACEFVTEKLELDSHFIIWRTVDKLNRFKEWDNQNGEE